MLQNAYFLAKIGADTAENGLVELRLEAAGGLPRVRGVHRVVRLEDEVRGELVEPAGAQQARNLDAIDWNLNAIGWNLNAIETSRKCCQVVHTI